MTGDYLKGLWTTAFSEQSFYPLIYNTSSLPDLHLLSSPKSGGGGHKIKGADAWIQADRLQWH